MAQATQDLSNVGVSIWLDDLSRSRLTSGNLKNLITERNVVGVTTNPTIFQGAISGGDGYETAIAEAKKQGLTATEAIFALTTQDVADACDVFTEVFDNTDGKDGRVSIEVEPGLADDAAGTVAQAKELWETQCDDQDSSHRGGCIGDRRYHRSWNQRERNFDI